MPRPEQSQTGASRVLAATTARAIAATQSPLEAVTIALSAIRVATGAETVLVLKRGKDGLELLDSVGVDVAPGLIYERNLAELGESFPLSAGRGDAGVVVVSRGRFAWASAIDELELLLDLLAIALRGYLLEEERLSAEAEQTRMEQAMWENELRLREAQRMDTLGPLAVGIVHDVNNTLAVILGFAEVLATRVPKASPLWTYVNEILQAAERSVALTRQVLAHRHPRSLQVEVIDVNRAIDDLRGFLQAILGDGVRLSARLAPDVLPVRLDRAELEQVIVNLVVNARDAMPRGGRLEVVASNVEIDEAFLQGHRRPTFGLTEPGSYVRIAVADAGLGMERKTLARVFDPFFTTKEPERGTGLGLSTVYRIVSQNAGAIWIESQVGAGTTVTIYLPAARRQMGGEMLGEDAGQS